MRISCPKCDAAYDVPDTALAAGPRRLRCARCGHQFQAALPGAATGSGAAPARAEPSSAAGSAPHAADLLRAKLAAAPAPPLATPPTTGPLPPRLAEKMAADRAPASTAKAPPEPAAEPPPAPALPPIPENRSQARLRDAPASPPDRFALAGWLLTVAVMAVAGYAAYAFRAEIVAAWPPALRVYALLGLT